MGEVRAFLMYHWAVLWSLLLKDITGFWALLSRYNFLYVLHVFVELQCFRGLKSRKQKKEEKHEVSISWESGEILFLMVVLLSFFSGRILGCQMLRWAPRWATLPYHGFLRRAGGSSTDFWEVTSSAKIAAHPLFCSLTLVLFSTVFFAWGEREFKGNNVAEMATKHKKMVHSSVGSPFLSALSVNLFAFWVLSLHTVWEMSGTVLLAFPTSSSFDDLFWGHWSL